MAFTHLCAGVYSLTAKNKLIVLLIAVLAFCACENQPEETRAEKILRMAEGGDFRGVNIGDDRDDVRKAENAESVYTMPDELVFRMDPNGDDSTWYEISYNFNQQGLYDIKLEIFPKEDSILKTLKGDFIAYYQKKYGDCKYQNGYCQWRAMTENGHIVSISLTDSLSGAPRPCLKVNFNESQNQ